MTGIFSLIQKYRVTTIKTVETMTERLLILDTDQGPDLVEKVDDLKELVRAFKKGEIKEQY